MAHFIKIQRKEILEITKKYNLDLIEYAPVEQGQGNSTYLLQTAHRKYILTIFEIEKKRVSNLCKLLNLLHEHNFPTTRVKKMANGEQLISIQGKLAMLKPYIAGQVVEDVVEDMLFQVGTAMARLHQIPEPDYMPDQFEFGLEFVQRVIGMSIDPDYKNWLTQRYEEIKRNIPSELPCGLIHGDVFYDNVLFDGNKFKALIDFEDSCNYYKVFDLGMAVVGMCTEKLKIQLPKIRSLIQGYQKIRKLENTERRALKLFVVYAASSTSAWRFWKYNIDTPTAARSEKYKELIEIAKSADAISNEAFMISVFS